jgi:nucleoside-diphosphate-sugar epimerase
MNLVFGASGFLGSQTTISLSNSCFSVNAIMRNSSNSWRLQGRSEINIVKLKESEFTSYLESVNPSVVIAANWQGVRDSLRADKKIQESSAQCILKLATAAKKSGVKTFVAFGSQAEVRRSNKKVTETYGNSPVGVYGGAKGLLAQELKELFRNSKTRFCWVRPFSIYGPMDSATALVPQMFLAASRGITFEVANPNLSWSYLHISDFGTAMLKILGNEELEGVINVGSTDSISILRIAQLAEREIKTLFPNWSGITLKEKSAFKGRIPITAKLDESGWSAQVPIEKGIAETVQWLSGSSDQLDV